MTYTIVLIALLTVAGGQNAGVEPTEPLVVHGASASELDVLDHALDLFADAGLDLPRLDVAFHDGRRPCKGRHGDFVFRNGLATINICNPTTHIVIHELSHAAVSVASDSASRARFMDELGIDSWNDPNDQWANRGTERAANMVGLVLEWQPGAISDDRAVDLLCGFETLTGHGLPGTIPAECNR